MSFSPDLTSWEIGPYHGALPGPMRLNLRLDGEVIHSGEVETGFIHRGLEKAIELHPWQSSIIYADHVDPENAVFGELALCLAVEEISETVVPPRASVIRVVLCELSRISSHLSYIVRMARAVGNETLIHYVLRDRERILDLFELLTGARFSLGFLRFGGVRADVSEGFIERVIEVCELIHIRLKEYNDLFTFNHAFIMRTKGVGVISQQMVKHFGITGPNARASGMSFDVRKTHPYSGYDSMDFEVPLSKGTGRPIGDAHDRFLLRLREISESLEILKQAVDQVPAGEFLQGRMGFEFRVAAGEAYSRVESPRGLLGCHVVSDGEENPNRVQFRPASLAQINLVPRMVIGIRLEDLPPLLASLDFNIAEVDR